MDLSEISKIPSELLTQIVNKIKSAQRQRRLKKIFLGKRNLQKLTEYYFLYLLFI